MKRLDGKVTVITGGASGLGRATVLRFAEEGARIVVADIDDRGGEETAHAVIAAGGAAIYQATDVRDETAVAATVRRAEDHFGQLDIMVANAGIAGAASCKRLEDVSEPEWATVMEINLGGVWRSFKHAIPALRRAGGGAMTSTASLAGVAILGDSHCGTYTAAKFGIVGLTRYFASELVAEGIRVNCVCPGSMTTNIRASMGEAGQTGRIASMTTSTRSTRRLVSDPREVANLHLFLCSEEASFITGQAMVADGGAELFVRLD